jgi:hypothetical protein
LVFLHHAIGIGRAAPGVEHDQHPLHIAVTNLSRQLVNGLMTWNGHYKTNGLTTIGADELRTETRIETRAAQGGDSEITVLSPIHEADMCEVHTRCSTLSRVCFVDVVFVPFR